SGSKTYSSGDFIIRAPNHTFELLPIDTVEYYIIYFTEHLIPSSLLIDFKKSAGAYSIAKSDMPSLFDRFDWHVEHVDDDKAVIKMLFRCVLTEIIVYFSKMYRSEPEKIRIEPHSIDAVINYIEQNISQPIQIKDICDKFFFSRSYLCRLFPEKVGIPLVQFIHMKRMNYANALIRSGMSATQAAAQLGFADYSSFYRQYEKFIGCSPSRTEKQQQ
ncbi:MAG: AraC family transcriptional regulator, partial [Clostridia bacterium]|nr:AraC family transcriptional regulator [Clostridia bacterium]